MDNSVKKRNHVLADKFNIIIALVLMTLATFSPGFLVSTLLEEAFKVITHTDMKEYMMAGNEIPQVVTYAFFFGAIILSFLMLLIFEWWFRDEYDGSMHVKGFGTGMKFAAPFIIFWVVWYIIQIAIGISTCDPLTPYVLVQGFRAGIVEEAAYRGIGVALILRAFKSKNNIILPTVITSVAFGLSHLVNIFSGSDTLEVLAQTVFAVVFGIIFGLIFTYSGNIWPVILFHSLYDAATFFISGVEDGFSWTNVIDLVGPTVILIFMLRVFNKDKDRMVALWNEKWKNNELA